MRGGVRGRLWTNVDGISGRTPPEAVARTSGEPAAPDDVRTIALPLGAATTTSAAAAARTDTAPGGDETRTAVMGSTPTSRAGGEQLHVAYRADDLVEYQPAVDLGCHRCLVFL